MGHRPLIAALVVVIALALLRDITLPAPDTAAAQTGGACSAERSVQVSGAATVNVVPDRALVWLGVQSSDVAPDAAQAKNQAAIERVIAAVRQLGVPEQAIATDAYRVTPVYAPDGLTITGYHVDNVVAVTLSDTRLVGKAIIAAFKAGANQVGDVQFYTSELRRFRDQAREQAMRAASEKASALARAAGAEAGCVLTIGENSWASYGGGWNRGGLNQWAQNVVQNAGGQEQAFAGEAPISVGRIAVRAEVHVSFALR